MDQSPEAAQIFRLFNEIGIINQLATALFNRLLPEGMHVSHFAVLNHLVRLGDGRTPLQIASALQVNKATMTHTLGILTRLGFVELAPHTSDGRSKLVFLTDQGRRFREQAIESLAPALNLVGGALSPDEVGGVLPVLEKIRALLDKEREQPE